MSSPPQEPQKIVTCTGRFSEDDEFIFPDGFVQSFLAGEYKFVETNCDHLVSRKGKDNVLVLKTTSDGCNDVKIKHRQCLGTFALDHKPRNSDSKDASSTIQCKPCITMYKNLRRNIGPTKEFSPFFEIDGKELRVINFEKLVRHMLGYDNKTSNYQPKTVLRRMLPMQKDAILLDLLLKYETLQRDALFSPDNSSDDEEDEYTEEGEGEEEPGETDADALSAVEGKYVMDLLAEDDSHPEEVNLLAEEEDVLVAGSVEVDLQFGDEIETQYGSEENVQKDPEMAPYRPEDSREQAKEEEEEVQDRDDNEPCEETMDYEEDSGMEYHENMKTLVEDMSELDLSSAAPSLLPSSSSTAEEYDPTSSRLDLDINYFDKPFDKEASPVNTPTVKETKKGDDGKALDNIFNNVIRSCGLSEKLCTPYPGAEVDNDDDDDKDQQEPAAVVGKSSRQLDSSNFGKKIFRFFKKESSEDDADEVYVPTNLFPDNNNDEQVESWMVLGGSNDEEPAAANRMLEEGIHDDYVTPSTSNIAAATSSSSASATKFHQYQTRRSGRSRGSFDRRQREEPQPQLRYPDGLQGIIDGIKDLVVDMGLYIDDSKTPFMTEDDRDFEEGRNEELLSSSAAASSAARPTMDSAAVFPHVENIAFLCDVLKRFAQVFAGCKRANAPIQTETRRLCILLYSSIGGTAYEKVLRFLPLLSAKEVRKQFYLYSTNHSGAHLATICDMADQMDRLTFKLDTTRLLKPSKNEPHGEFLSPGLSPNNNNGFHMEDLGILAEEEERIRNIIRKYYVLHYAFDAVKLVEEVSIDHNRNTLNGFASHKSMQDSAEALLASSKSEKLGVATAQYCTAWIATPVHVGSVGRFVAGSFYHRNESSSLVLNQLVEMDVKSRFAGWNPFFYSSDSASWNVKALESIMTESQPARGIPHEKLYQIYGCLPYAPEDPVFVDPDKAHCLKALRNNVNNKTLVIPVVRGGEQDIIPVEVDWDSLMKPLVELQDVMGMTRLVVNCKLNSIIESVSNSYSKMKVSPATQFFSPQLTELQEYAIHYLVPNINKTTLQALFDDLYDDLGNVVPIDESHRRARAMAALMPIRASIHRWFLLLRGIDPNNTTPMFTRYFSLNANNVEIVSETLMELTDDLDQLRYEFETLCIVNPRFSSYKPYVNTFAYQTRETVGKICHGVANGAKYFLRKFPDGQIHMRNLGTDCVEALFSSMKKIQPAVTQFSAQIGIARYNGSRICRMQNYVDRLLLLYCKKRKLEDPPPSSESYALAVDLTDAWFAPSTKYNNAGLHDTASASIKTPFIPTSSCGFRSSSNSQTTQLTNKNKKRRNKGSIISSNKLSTEVNLRNVENLPNVIVSKDLSLKDLAKKVVGRCHTTNQPTH